MRETEKQRFAVLIQALGATFRTEVSAAMAEGYWLGLSDIPLSKVQQAVQLAIRESRFMPTPAELRSYVGAPRARQPEYYRRWVGPSTDEARRIAATWEEGNVRGLIESLAREKS